MLTAWPDHLSRADKMYAIAQYGLTPDKVYGPAVGWIVGEQPGKSTDPHAPLFPHPNGCAGDRLYKMSGMEVGDYLGKLHRINLIESLVPWSVHVARTSAIEWLAEWKAMGGQRVILCGTLVREAFGVPSWWTLVDHDGVRAVAIPHPSGLTRAYNDEKARVATRAALAWAAGTMNLEMMP